MISIKVLGQCTVAAICLIAMGCSRAQPTVIHLIDKTQQSETERYVLVNEIPIAKSDYNLVGGAVSRTSIFGPNYRCFDPGFAIDFSDGIRYYVCLDCRKIGWAKIWAPSIVHVSKLSDRGEMELKLVYSTYFK